ncbi:XaxB [Xenorhabdus sp. 12]|uniref:XaxB n=1 Tax=Xenorhabdus santafensis TaxID=2582833 RepID=A0ABU4S9G8_9GAMM|nr:alpha-xenorhabdolysin family binary toxin subunit B [Xenorhabdus sp. 12]MDX7987453.1 XaxB [Xenorhabdus sp. 12]
MSDNMNSQKENMYPQVNIKALELAVKNIWSLSAMQKTDLGPINEKTKRLELNSRELTQSMHEYVTQLSVELKQLTNGELFQMVLQIDEAMQDPSLSEDDRNSLLQEREQLILKLSKDTDRVIVSFSGKSGQLAEKMSYVRNIVLAERLHDLIEQTKVQETELQADIKQKGEQRNKLNADRDKIIESQDVIRANNIADMFKDFIPSASDIDKLDLSDPKKEAIKQAIKQGMEITRKILGKVSEGLKYIDLADARTKLTDQIAQIIKDTDSLKTKLQAVTQRFSDLNNVMKIDSERDILLSEVNKVHQAWSLFSDQLHKLSGNKIEQSELGSLINGQVSFLDDLVTQYLDVK